MDSVESAAQGARIKWPPGIAHQERRLCSAYALARWEAPAPRNRREADAVKLLKRRHAEIEGGRFVPDAGRVLFDDLADMVVADYEANGRRSLGTVKNALANLRVAFGGEPALAITTDRITGYVRERQRKPDENTAGAANATIRKELAALRRGFNLAPACRKACPRTPASWPCSGSSARRRRISSAAAGGGGVAGS